MEIKEEEDGEEGDPSCSFIIHGPSTSDLGANYPQKNLHEPRDFEVETRQSLGLD